MILVVEIPAKLRFPQHTALCIQMRHTINIESLIHVGFESGWLLPPTLNGCNVSHLNENCCKKLSKSILRWLSIYGI